MRLSSSTTYDWENEKMRILDFLHDAENEMLVETDMKDPLGLNDDEDVAFPDRDASNRYREQVLNLPPDVTSGSSSLLSCGSM